MLHIRGNYRRVKETRVIYDVMSNSSICGALYVVPASTVRKMNPLGDETKASVKDTGKKEQMIIKRGRQHVLVLRMIESGGGGIMTNG